MVQQLTTISPRTQDPVTLTNPETGLSYFPTESNKERTVFRFVSTLNAYTEVTVEATDSADADFSDSVTLNDSRPIPANTTRELRVTGPYEYLKFTVEATQSAPTTGEFKVRSLADNSDAILQSEILDEFEALNQGKTHISRYQESIADGGTVSLGIRNDNASTLYIEKIGLPVGGDALIRTSIDHGSYTDGTQLDLINGRPALQAEKTLQSVISANPTYSDPQVEIEGFRPGGSGRAIQATPGGEESGAVYEIEPGQTLVFELENDSGATNRYGFLLRVIETVIR